ncbi:hypothetical protein CAPTEDRAFT_210549 [Capitella teleta]|uniref:G-protein coupled receptors family 1 profile domain-containing protein n=1 Tax=Capitella teleta TaxID=283909 RepID=R7T9G5_CAPTE|nr:hypothetical protein CAPTEDRAFT_210549 [Capitella teleta]|eukprot:ELT90324.1 hypothetical protein CAPTEDRAFT_210549 [Capitella teleta]
MAFSFSLLACVCGFVVAGLHASNNVTENTEVTGVTEVATTEDPFYVRLRQALADPIRFQQANNLTNYALSCGWALFAENERFWSVLEDVMCICFLEYCKRELTQEEFDHHYHGVGVRIKMFVKVGLRDRWFYILIFAILIVVGICGNITILVVIACYMGKKKSATNVLIANIAVSDLCTCVFCMPFKCYRAVVLHGLYGRHWIFNAICKGVWFMYYTSFSCSILTMLAIGLERFLVICYPLRAVSLTTISNTNKVAALVWVIALASASPNLIYYYQKEGGFCRIADENRQAYYGVYHGFLAIIIFAIPVVTLIIIYSKIIYTLHKSIKTARRMRATSSTNDSKRRFDGEDIRSRKQVIFVHLSLNLKMTKAFMSVFGALSLGNSAINPILIPVNSAQFRIGIKKAFGLYRPVKPNLDVDIENYFKNENPYVIINSHILLPEIV